MLISAGLNVVFVSRQLGHANAQITLRVYAHLFARADHAETARAAIEAQHHTLAWPGPSRADHDSAVETAVVTGTRPKPAGT